MKRLILAVTAAMFAASAAIGAPAVPGSLADYLALGPGGATIGGTLFSDFSLLPTQAGATPINPANVLVTPLTDPGNPGFQFTLNQSALAAELFELRLSYSVLDVAISGASVEIGGAMTTDDGAITSSLDGLPAGGPLIAFSTFGITDSPVQTAFAPVGMLVVESSMVVDGGLAGTADLASTSHRFVVESAVVPEPATFGFGLAVLGVCATRRRRRT